VAQGQVKNVEVYSIKVDQKELVSVPCPQDIVICRQWNFYLIFFTAHAADSTAH